MTKSQPRHFVCAQWPAYPKYPSAHITSEHVCSCPTVAGNVRKARAYKRAHPERTVYLYTPDDFRTEVSL